MPELEGAAWRALSRELERQKALLTRNLNRQLFDSVAIEREQVMRDTGRTIFGDILEPTPDPLAGLKAMLGVE